MFTIYIKPHNMLRTEIILTDEWVRGILDQILEILESEIQEMKNKRIASSDTSLPKGNRRSRGLWEESESGTVLGTTLRSMQQPMRRISWAASLCLPLPVDKNHGIKSMADLK